MAKFQSSLFYLPVAGKYMLSLKFGKTFIFS